MEYLETLFHDSTLVATMQKAVFGSAEWAMLDRGVISQAQARERLTNQYPHLKEEIDVLFRGWMEILTPIPSTVEVLRQLKNDGYKLYVISNFHKAAFEKVYEKNDWFKLFDGLIISCDIKSLKPEPAIYQALLDQYKLVPGESVFIDDLAANVEGARQMGMEAIWYQNAAQFCQDLKAIITPRNVGGKC